MEELNEELENQNVAEEKAHTATETKKAERKNRCSWWILHEECEWSITNIFGILISTTRVCLGGAFYNFDVVFLLSDITLLYIAHTKL